MFTRIVPIVLLLLLVGCHQSKQEELDSTIEDMVVGLEEPDFNKKEFLGLHADPAFVESEKQDGEWDEVVAQFGSTDKNELHRALTVARNVRPQFERDSTVAIFEHPELNQSLRFTYVDGEWYLMN
mgnify:FL=1